MNKQLQQAYEDYIKLLGEELNDTVLYAHQKGWKSTRHQEGERLRMLIYNLKDSNWQQEYTKRTKSKTDERI